MYAEVAVPLLTSELLSLNVVVHFFVVRGTKICNNRSEQFE